MRTNLVLPVCSIALGVTLIAQSLGAATFIQNPSFELNYNPVFPGYSAIDFWTGAAGANYGVNEIGGPFHNPPTQIPDQARAGFVQGSGSIRQTITGLIPGQLYCLQFFYDARDCCGGTVNLTTSFGGIQVDRVTNVRPTPTVPNHNFYYSRSLLVTALTDTAELVFETATTGDATVVLDAISLVPCATNSLPVLNASFEASGNVPLPGNIVPGQNLAGWTIGGVGNVGINARGEGFADNGVNPDQDHVVFLVNQSSISQVLNGLIPGSNYMLSFSYNQRVFDASHLRVTVGTDVLFDADVTEVGADLPYHTFEGMFTASDISMTLTFEQTTPSDQAALIDHVSVRGETGVVLNCLDFSTTAAELAPGQTLTVTLSVDPRLTENQSVTIRLRSPNLNVAELIGAEADGSLPLFFDFGQTSNTFDIRAVARGTIRIEIVESAGVCTDEDVSVTVVNSFVRNASFESSAVPLGVGLGNIVAWNSTGGVGLNNAAGPFHDNGLIPDRRQVAFVQQIGSLSQEIVGLTAGQRYWLQFHYNARNCCGGTIDLQVRFGGAELMTIANVAPVGEGMNYHFQNIAFVPTNAVGLLEFVTTATGDASLLLDAVSVVQREPGDIVIRNPSFEGTGVPSGVGYIQPDPFAGWITSGGYGPNLDGVGPFTDNGDAPDQDIVAFLQGAASLSQNVSGFSTGATYTVLYAVNARNCCSAGPTHYTVAVAGVELVSEDIAPVGGGNPFETRGAIFQASSGEAELRFAHAPPDGDRTLLLDDIRICLGDCRPRPRLGATLVQDVVPVIRLTWPISAAGYILECNTEIEGGTWTEVPWPVQVEGDEFVVIDDTSASTQKFYRLRLPPPPAAAGR